MFTITILAMLVTLASATLSITGFTVTSPVAAQMTSDNATMSGNMTSGNATGGNTTGSISSLGEDGGGTVSDDDSGVDVLIANLRNSIV
jgi:hypothetical protein